VGLLCGGILVAPFLHASTVQWFKDDGSMYVRAAMGVEPDSSILNYQNRHSRKLIVLLMALFQRYLCSNDGISWNPYR
jgi:hypothetical protein